MPLFTGLAFFFPSLEDCVVFPSCPYTVKDDTIAIITTNNILFIISLCLKFSLFTSKTWCHTAIRKYVSSRYNTSRFPAGRQILHFWESNAGSAHLSIILSFEKGVLSLIIIRYR